MQQFLSFIQDFLNLCQFESWPDNNTTEDEIKNAFLTAQHVEKCFDKLQKRNSLNEFLSLVNDSDESTGVVTKNCLSDPSKYVLKKILHSKTKISQVDIGFKIFLELHSEQKLEDCLTELVVEAASKETLLKNLNHVSKDKILHFKCILFLSELNACDDMKESVLQLLRNINQGTLELLMLCLLNKDMKYLDTVATINEAFACTMASKSHDNQSFWKNLLNSDEKLLTQMCLEHVNLFRLVCKALIDCSKLLRENMSSEFFYINITYSELVVAVKKLCESYVLKENFFDSISNSTFDLDFWQSMLL